MLLKYHMSPCYQYAAQFAQGTNEKVAEAVDIEMDRTLNSVHGRDMVSVHQVFALYIICIIISMGKISYLHLLAICSANK